MPPRPAPTHFLCIPLVTGTSRPQLSASLAAFKADVTSPDSFAVPEQAVRPLGTLHLTLGVMSFPSSNNKKSEGLEQAVSLLQSLAPRRILAEITGAGVDDQAATALKGSPSPLRITLKGLQSMQSPAKATILYAPPADDEEGTTDGSGSVLTLTRFCEQIRKTFVDAGLMEDESRPLLLHSTILNTIYVKGGGRGKGGGHQKKKRLTIDARDILDRYGDYVWMRDVPVEKLAICQMGAKAVEPGDDGEGGGGDAAYVVESSVDV